MDFARNFRWIVGCPLLAALGCGTDDGRTKDSAAGPDSGADAAVLPPEPQWSPCEETDLAELECATLDVPLDYGDPEGEKIQLGITRLAATDPARRVGVLLVNPGGPGVHGRSFPLMLRHDTLAAEYPEVLARFDLIGFDPRGVGASTPTDCGDVQALEDVDWSPDDDAEWNALEQAMRDFVAACETGSGRLLEHIDSYSTAFDMDFIRQSLREEKINYWGFSYGTVLGANYVRLFPDNLRAAMLMSAVGPGLDGPQFIADRAANMDRVFDDFAADCAARPECSAKFGGDVRSAFDVAVSKVATAPLVDPVSGKTLNESQLGVWLAFLLTQMPNGATTIENFVDALKTGFPSDQIALVRHGAQGLAETTVPIHCVDLAFPDPAAFRQRFAADVAAHPRLAHGELSCVLPCEFWPVKPRARPPVQAPGTPGPVIVVGSTGDPNTPFAWSEKLAQDLKDAVLLVRDDVGHGGFSPCIDDALNAELFELAVPPAGTVCPAP